MLELRWRPSRCGLITAAFLTAVSPSTALRAPLPTNSGIVNTDPSDGSELQKQIDSAIASGAALVTALKRNYEFAPGTSLRISGATNLAVGGISGGLTQLWFACGQGVHIANATDVVFERFEIDYKTPCFSQGKVTTPPVAVGKNESVGVVFDQDNFPSAEESVALAGNGSLKVTYWDPTSLRMIAHGNHMVVNVSFGPETLIEYWGKVSPEGAVTKGTLVTMHPRLGISQGTGVAGGLTYMITNSSRVSTVNVSVYGGATEAIVEGGGEGNHTYRFVRVVRREGQTPVRLLAANADGFHSSCVTQGPTLVDSEISWTGDDLLNIHSRMAIVLQPLSSTAAYIIDTVGSSSPADYDDSTLTLERTRVGDHIAFWALGSLEANGSSNVASLQRVYDASVIANAEEAQIAINAPPYSQRISHPFGSRVWLVNWTTPVSLSRFTLVDIPRLRPVGARVLRCYLHDSYMRTGLYDSPNQRIEGNHFARAFPLYVGETGDGWLEGPPSVGPTIVQGNTFEDIFGGCGWHVNSKTTHQVVVVNNSCVDSNRVTVPCPPCSSAGEPVAPAPPRSGHSSLRYGHS